MVNSILLVLLSRGDNMKTQMEFLVALAALIYYTTIDIGVHMIYDICDIKEYSKE